MLSFKLTRNLLIAACFTVLVAGCENSHNQDKSSMNMRNDIELLDIDTRKALEQVVDSRVFFAHHSVGKNIIEGFEEMLDEAGLQYPVVNIYKQKPPEGNVLMHANPGENKRPKTKVKGFKELIRELKMHAPQIAFMKYCFVDFDPYTKVDEVFEDYKSAIETLKSEQPDLTVAHVTVPLKKYSDKLKQRIDRALGRLVWEDASNIRRAEFNHLLINHYKDDPIFDLARIQSTRSDGQREQHLYKGQEFYSLAPEYTTDGGHLNSLGKRVAAAEMTRFLAKAIEKRETGNQ